MIVVLLLVVIALLFLIGNINKKKRLVLTESNVYLKIGEKYTLSLTRYNDNIVWESSDNSIVSVDDNGEVNALKYGVATIKVRVKDDASIFDNCIINVVESRIADISDKKLNLVINESYGVSVNFASSYTDDKTIVWSSDNSEIATINKDGFITGKKYGTTTINALLKNGDVLSCEVEVVDRVIDISNIYFSENEVHVEIGSEKKLDYIVEPSNSTDKSISFVSNNPKVVTVDEKGFIKAISTGRTLIDRKSVV